MPWYANHICTTFIAKIDMLNRFDQSLVLNFFKTKTFLVAPFVPINFAACAVLDLCFDRMGDGRLNHIGICISGRVFLTSSHASVRPPFLHKFLSKNRNRLF